MKSEIEKSEVFKILREMPKGAILHIHQSAMSSLEYKLNNVSYRENLYVCDRNDSLQLKFLKNPDGTCDWQLLSKVRQDARQAEAINDRIRRSLTMITENPRSDYNTVDKAWEKFNSIFTAQKPWLSYRPVFEDIYYRALQDFYEDNIMYAEIRSTLSSIYDFDRVYGPFEMAEIIKNVTDRYKAFSCLNYLTDDFEHVVWYKKILFLIYFNNLFILPLQKFMRKEIKV